MPQSQVTEVDVLRETVRHNEKSIDALTADFKEFRKEVNGTLEDINKNINTKFEAVNNRFITLYALIAFSILIPIGIAIFQSMKH